MLSPAMWNNSRALGAIAFSACAMRSGSLALSISKSAALARLDETLQPDLNRLGWVSIRGGLGNVSTGCRKVAGGVAVVTSIARSRGSVPPNVRAMLNRERLPQTQQRSCGLSLTTSQSAHSTALLREIAFSGGSFTPISTTASFICSPPPNLGINHPIHP